MDGTFSIFARYLIVRTILLSYPSNGKMETSFLTKCVRKHSSSQFSPTEHRLVAIIVIKLLFAKQIMNEPAKYESTWCTVLFTKKISALRAPWQNWRRGEKKGGIERNKNGAEAENWQTLKTCCGCVCGWSFTIFKYVKKRYILDLV